MPGSIRRYLLEALEHLVVEVHTGAEVVGASDGSVIAMVDGQQRQFAAGSVVVAIGRVPNAGLADELEQAGFRVQVVGDAVEPRHMQAAVYEGAEASGVVGGV